MERRQEKEARRHCAADGSVTQELSLLWEEEENNPSQPHSAPQVQSRTCGQASEAPGSRLQAAPVEGERSRKEMPP